MMNFDKTWHFDRFCRLYYFRVSRNLRPILIQSGPSSPYSFFFRFLWARRLRSRIRRLPRRWFSPRPLVQPVCRSSSGFPSNNSYLCRVYNFSEISHFYRKLRIDIKWIDFDDLTQTKTKKKRVCDIFGRISTNKLINLFIS